MGLQLGLLGSDSALAVAQDSADKPRQIGYSDPAPVARQQLEIACAVALRDKPRRQIVRELPRVFHRRSAGGRELRDGAALSGAPRRTGDGQYSFRQRREDGHWRLVTVLMTSDKAVIKSITEWSPFLPNHTEASA